MTDIREYTITTDYGVMAFTSEDVVGYWWQRIIEEMNSERLGSERETQQYNLLAAYNVAKYSSITAADDSARFADDDPNLAKEFEWFAAQFRSIRELLQQAGVNP